MIKHVFLGYCISIACCLLVGCQPETGPDADTQTKIDAVFAEWNHPNMPGCALAVVHQGEIIYSRGYGMADLEHDLPITPASVFYIGSVSKQFVTTSLLLLEEEGQLSLDDDVRRYIPELPDYGHTITLRNLVHHTSGLRDNLTLWELSGRNMIDDIPEEEIFEMITRQQGLNFVPGEEYAYSNTCYFLMSIIIERVSGQRLRDFAETRIFQPLDMHNSQFNDDNRRILKNRAFAYTQMDGDSIGNLLMRFDLVGSGGLYSTVEDLYLWDQNFYDNRLGKRGKALIDQLQTNGKYDDGSEVDYAFAMINGTYRGLKTIHHTGSMGGYRAVYLRFPEEAFSVIILGNVDSFQPLDRAYEVADIMLADNMQDKAAEVTPPENLPQASPETNVSAALPAGLPENMAGTYYSPELNASYQLRQEGKDSLALKVAGKPEVLLGLVNERNISNNTYNIIFDQNFEGFTLSFLDTKGIIFTRR
jgi:CubicO group peptidase (beta-lactamase class C family)